MKNYILIPSKAMSIVDRLSDEEAGKLFNAVLDHYRFGNQVVCEDIREAYEQFIALIDQQGGMDDAEPDT